MKLSILILSCDRIEALKMLIAKIIECRQDIYEVIVEDNSKLVENIEEVKRICNENKFILIQEVFTPYNMGHMRNLAIEKATGDVLVFLDADIVPYNNDFFKLIQERHSKENNILLISPRFKGGEDSATLYQKDNKYYVQDSWKKLIIEKTPIPWRCASGGACSIRKEVLGCTRYDSRFAGNWGWEDIDFTRQLWDKGVKIVLGEDLSTLHVEHLIKDKDRLVNKDIFHKKWSEITLKRLRTACAEKKINFDSRVKRYEKYFKDIYNYQDADFKSVLEIGGGDGFFSHYIACKFGCDVFCVDNYNAEGNRSDFEEINSYFCEKIKDSVMIVKKGFLDYERVKFFDLIIAVISLHHIVPTKERFEKGLQAYSSVLKLYKKVCSLLKNGGEFHFQEVMPIDESNVFFEREKGKVNFSTKHSAEEWAIPLLSAGFVSVNIDYIISKEASKVKTSYNDKVKMYCYDYVVRAKKHGA